jgi:predicted dehydrogenase
MAAHNRPTRRQILKRAAQAGLASAAPYMLTSSALGADDKPAASERLTIGFIGAGGMGRSHMHQIGGFKDLQFVAVADVYANHRKMAVDMLGPHLKEYNDYRELLARPDIDAVIIAVPDHWHALIAIEACDAGKDVYCEKPLSYSIREARLMVEAARRNGTVFQVGSQQRSSGEFRKACEYVRSGRIGKLQWIEAGIGGGPVCAWEPNQPVPDGLDWNFWLGPAPYAEYTKKRFDFDFRWFYDYSGGIMTDWGAHHNDIAQWGNGTSHTGPIRTEPIMAKFPQDGLYDTVTNFEIHHTYENGVLLKTTSRFNGVHFQGSDGWIKVNRGYFEASDPDIDREPLSAGEVHLYNSPGHHRDWINCITTRQRPICDAEIGARSVTICHLGNIAARTGRTIEWDPKTETITNDKSLNERWLHRPYRGPWKLPV